MHCLVHEMGAMEVLSGVVTWYDSYLERLLMMTKGRVRTYI